MRSNSPTATLIKVVSLFHYLPASTTRIVFPLFNLLSSHHQLLSLLRPASAFVSLPTHPCQLSFCSSSSSSSSSTNPRSPLRKVVETHPSSRKITAINAIRSYSAEQTEIYSIMPPSPPSITYEILSEQNATTTNAIIEHYSTSSEFLSLAKSEGDGILQRDDEDASKLQKGIDIAKEKGVLDPQFVPEEYIEVDVLGKSPEDVADEILGTVRKGGDGDGGSGGGGVVVLCGLSGTGKGTTVAKLKEKLEKEDKKRVVCWSNGNIFRSVTLLAVTWCEQQEDCDGFDPSKALTKENLASFMGMLEFGKFNGKFDTKITGLGLNLLISEVQNTQLKSPKVSKNIPTVAEVTQGEVVLFASDAISKMGADGIFTLLEGREQTVNYVRTPLRFTLTLSDTSLIGKRRAAQRLAAGALKEVGRKDGDKGEEEKEEVVGKALDGQLESMVKEAEAGN
mmetsp:Transcript_15093/g.27268  ORF Transcript_15093/g.27268 Transcript_15093/m.27268 type:complete len:452 (-) Transcript_15093:261-1616(-)